MPVQHYSDPFGPFFYLWLFQNASSNDRATWAYNHRSEISDDRWKDMVAKDAQLEARVKQLEASGLTRDPKYVPPEMKGNEDLMYSEEFVKAAYNPTPPPAPLVGNTIPYAKPAKTSIVMSVVTWLVVISVCLLIVYFVFLFNWKKMVKEWY